MAINTTFDPINISDFDKTKLRKSAVGLNYMADAGVTSSLDYTLTDDMLLTGSYLLVSGGTIGDKASFQVLAGSNVIVTFVSDWYIDIAKITQDTPKSNYPAKATAGLTLRISYTSIGTDPVWVAINYDLNKVLI